MRSFTYRLLLGEAWWSVWERSNRGFSRFISMGKYEWRPNNARFVQVRARAVI